MSRKSIFTVVGGAALWLLFAAGILWVELLAAEAEYVEEQEPVSPPVAEAIRQETPQEAAYTNESTMIVTAYCPVSYTHLSVGRWAKCPAGHRETKGDGCGGLHVGDRHAGTEGQPLAGDRRAVRLHGGRAVEEGG